MTLKILIIIKSINYFKVNVFLASIILFISCSEPKLPFNKKILLNSGFSKNGIIVSCTRCSCINDFLHSEVFYKQKTSDIGIYIDSTCSPDFLSEYKPHFIKQNLIDSIYSENYNMMFYKILDNSKVDFILIKTEDNPENKMKGFFN